MSVQCLLSGAKQTSRRIRRAQDAVVAALRLTRINAVRSPAILEQHMPFNPRRDSVIQAVGIATLVLSVAAVVVVLSGL